METSEKKTDTNRVAPAILVGLCILSIAVWYGSVMIVEELHLLRISVDTIVIPTIGDLDGDGLNDDLAYSYDSRMGFVFANHTGIAKRGVYSTNMSQNGSYMPYGDVVDLVNLS